MVTAPSPADEPQISTKEMEQIEDFFAQLETDDARSDTGQIAEAEFRQDADERDVFRPSATPDGMTQSAEDVMNAYVEAFKNSDDKAMRSLETADTKEHWTSSFPKGFTAGILEVQRESADGMAIIEDPDVLEEARHQLERLMLEPVLKMVSQAEVVSSAYVGSEFHFRLGMPAPEMPVPNKEAVIETEIPSPPETLVKMRKEDDTWLIYDHETLD